MSHGFYLLTLRGIFDMYTLNEQRNKHAIWLVLRLNVHKQ